MWNHSNAYVFVFFNILSFYYGFNFALCTESMGRFLAQSCRINDSRRYSFKPISCILVINPFSNIWVAQSGGIMNFRFSRFSYLCVYVLVVCE